MKRFYAILTILFISLSTACAKGRSTKQGAANMKIKIEVTSESGSHSLTATLADNSSAAAFYALLQKGSVEIQMHDYANFEKVGSLGTSLPRNDRQITTCSGDIILYQGNQITIYYDVNSWNFTQLGKIDAISQAELKKILGKGNITAVFSVNE